MINVGQQVAFGVLALVMGVSALRVVTTKNVVHAALYLVMVLAGVGGIFILLASEFVAIVQVLVYIGAIVVLFLFGIMLTRARIGYEADLDNNQRGVGALIALFLFGVLTTVLVSGFDDDRLHAEGVGRTG